MSKVNRVSLERFERARQLAPGTKGMENIHNAGDAHLSEVIQAVENAQSAVRQDLILAGRAATKVAVSRNWTTLYPND